MVEIVATGTVLAAVEIDSGANGTEIGGVAITGDAIGPGWLFGEPQVARLKDIRTHLFIASVCQARASI